MLCILRHKNDIGQRVLILYISGEFAAQGYQEQALKIATDPDYKFELAVQLGKLEDAVDIVQVCAVCHFCMRVR